MLRLCAAPAPLRVGPAPPAKAEGALAIARQVEPTLEHDTSAFELTREATSGEPIAAFYETFAAFVRSSFAGARLFIATSDAQAGRLVRAYGPGVDLNDIDEEPRFARALGDRRPIVAADAAFYPLMIGSKAIGVAAIYPAAPHEAGASQAERLGAFLSCLALRIEREALLEQISDLESLAGFDGLTGILNRRSFDERLTLEWNRATRAGQAVAVIMLDIDFFKAFNDRYGHVAGDFCLRAVASALREGLGRASDTVARYGGEEFAAILPGTDLAGAIDVAEKMRAAVAALSVPHDASSLGRVSVSVGVATVQASLNGRAASALEKADRALYDAKLSGRNRVVAEDYTSDAPVAEPRRDRIGNLPPPATTFFGRMAELITIRRFFDESRLVTLTGAPGIGKTRLAIAHGSGVASHFEHGVWLVDLIGAATQDDVQRSVDRVLTAEVQTVNALLIFNNGEDVAGPLAKTIAGILESAPRVKVLVTSGAPLAIDGERVFPVPSLGIDEAVELFSDRAAAAGAPPLREGSRAAAAALCERLGGMPLAIELAAAALRNMPLDELARALEERLAAVAREAKSAALIDWSYASLAEQERGVLNRIAVFAGSFSGDAAAAICSAIPRNVASAVLTRLAEKWLIETEPESEPPRFRLRPPIRAFAYGRLLARNPHVVSAPHAVFFLNFAQKMVEAQASADPQQWRAAMLAERENFTQALRWALELEQDPALGGKLAASLTALWAEGGHEAAGLRWLDSALEPDHDVDDATRAKLHHGRARLLLNLGRHPEAQEALQRALEVYTSLGDSEGVARARAFVAEGLPG